MEDFDYTYVLLTRRPCAIRTLPKRGSTELSPNPAEHAARNPSYYSKVFSYFTKKCSDQCYRKNKKRTDSSIVIFSYFFFSSTLESNPGRRFFPDALGDSTTDHDVIVPPRISTLTNTLLTGRPCAIRTRPNRAGQPFSSNPTIRARNATTATQSNDIVRTGTSNARARARVYLYAIGKWSVTCSLCPDGGRVRFDKLNDATAVTYNIPYTAYSFLPWFTS